MATSVAPRAGAAQAVAAALGVLLALAAAVQGRSLPGDVGETPRALAAAAAAAQPDHRNRPEIVFFPDRGCGGLTDAFQACGCLPFRLADGRPNVGGYLVTFREPGQSAVLYSEPDCMGRPMAEIRENSCYCFPPPYKSIRFHCEPVVKNSTAALGRADEQ